MIGKNTNLLAEVASLNSMVPDDLFLLQLHALDVLLVLLFLASPLIQSQLRFGQVFLELVNNSSVVLLLILKSLSVLLFALAGVKSGIS